jgi:hypothetical protein
VDPVLPVGPRVHADDRRHPAKHIRSESADPVQGVRAMTLNYRVLRAFAYGMACASVVWMNFDGYLAFVVVLAALSLATGIALSMGRE